MKHSQERVGKTLDRLLARFDNPSAERMRSAFVRVSKKLRTTIGDDPVAAVSNSAIQRPRNLSWVTAAAAIMLVLGLSAAGVYMWVGRDNGAHAVVDTIDGLLLRDSQTIGLGDRVAANEILRTNDGGGAQFTLSDGSRVEMRAQSELLLERADDGVRIRLNKGGIIVNAAKQHMRHLYVQTKDVMVSVVGTVFFVNAEESGSRVAVVEGEVHVQQGKSLKKLLPGEQVVSSPLMKSQPVSEEIAWSRSAEAHLALLQQSTTIEPPPLQFEVASIKPDPQPTVGVLRGAVRCQGIDGGLSSPAGVTGAVPLGRCVGRHVPLVSLIGAAYDILDGDGVSWGDVSGGPNWAGSVRESFQIEAKAENPATATREQLRQMLQTLLADRFKLKVHRDTRESAGYVLTIAKSGLKLKEFAGAEETLTVGPAEGGGGARGGPGSGRTKFVVAGKSSVGAFAALLSACPLGRFLVVDKTELAGRYEFNLSFSLTGYHGTPCSPDFDPTLPKVLEDELGLRLESGQKVPEALIVIDHAEKPSEN